MSTYPLPAIPDGIPATCFAFYGVHGALWRFWYDGRFPDDQLQAWRADGHDDYYRTIDQLNDAHGPLRWDQPPYPVEDRTKPAYTVDGQQWTWNPTRTNNVGTVGGWCKTPVPPDESDDCLTWNWLNYVEAVTS